MNLPGDVPPPIQAEHSSGSASPSPRSHFLWIVWGLTVLLLTGVVVCGYWGRQAYLVSQEFYLAELALKEHDLLSASTHLDRYLSYRPKDAEALFLAGRTARRLERYGKAEEFLTRCQEVRGIRPETLLEWDLLRVQQGNIGEIDARLRQTITPDHPDAFLVLEALARGYIRCDRLVDALQACELWLQHQKDDYRPWLLRGDIFERLGHNQKALLDYEQAMELAPDLRETRLPPARLLAQTRQPEKAIRHFQFLVELSHEDQVAQLGLASCWIDQGQSQKAIPILEQILKRDPSNPRGMFLRGKAAFELGDVVGAEKWLHKAVQLTPHNSEALHQYILSLRVLKKDSEANQLVPRLDSLKKDLARLSELIAVVGRNPDDARPRHEAGVLALRIGAKEDGVRWLQSALRVRGDHRATHAALADYYRSIGDPKAEQHRQMAKHR